MSINLDEFLTKLFYKKNLCYNNLNMFLLCMIVFSYLTYEYCNYYNFFNWINVEKLQILNTFSLTHCFLNFLLKTKKIKKSPFEEYTSKLCIMTFPKKLNMYFCIYLILISLNHIDIQKDIHTFHHKIN